MSPIDNLFFSVKALLPGIHYPISPFDLHCSMIPGIHEIDISSEEVADCSSRYVVTTRDIGFILTLLLGYNCHLSTILTVITNWKSICSRN